MSDLAALVPVLGRPQRALPLVESWAATTPGSRLLFLCTEGDRAQIAACEVAAERYPFVHVHVVPFPRVPGDYARKVNYGVRVTDEPWLFHGADDLRFHDAWYERAMDTHGLRGRRVIGTNDLGNRLVVKGRHSTHSLVHRSYIEQVGTVDEPGFMLHEGYCHNFCDTELVQAAMIRGEWEFARDAIVEHMHPLWGKGEEDDTYRLGLADFTRDQRYFSERRRLWHVRPTRRR